MVRLPEGPVVMVVKAEASTLTVVYVDVKTEDTACLVDGKTEDWLRGGDNQRHRLSAA